MVSTALICSGICSFVQVMRFKVPQFGFFPASKVFIGTGMVSVMGTSFAFLPAIQSAVLNMVSCALPCLDALTLCDSGTTKGLTATLP